MLFFINPVSSLLHKLSDEKKLLQLLGLAPVSNSVNEFQLYYEKLLGFVVYHLEKTMAEIENETVEEQPAVQQPEIQQPEIQQPSYPEIPGYTQEEIYAYDSLFGELPPSPTPAVEETIQPATPTTPVETEPTQEIDEELETETIKERLLESKNKKELDAIKAENPEAVTAIWNELTIPEKNHIKCITQSVDGRKRPITPGYRFIYTAPNGSEQYVRYIGFYLHGEAITDEDKRAILLDGIGIICSKKDLKPSKKQFVLTEGEVEHLKDMMSNPGKIKAIDTTETVETEATEEVETPTAVETETPTAKDMAENNFTGLVEAPKKSPAGSMTGKTQSLQPSKQNAEQKVLDLRTSNIEPETTTEVQPTKWLLAIEREIKKVNPEVAIQYDAFGECTFLEVYHGDAIIGTFEDDGKDIWMKGCSKMKHHGFTEEKLDRLADKDYLESLQSPKA